MCNSNENNQVNPTRRRQRIDLQDALPNRDRCFFDKLVIKLDGITLNFSQAQHFDQLKARLRDSALGENYYTLRDPNAGNNRNATQRSQSNYINLTVVSNLLYSGRIDIKRSNANSRQATISMSLSLNPTRFVAYLTANNTITEYDNIVEQLVEMSAHSLLYREEHIRSVISNPVLTYRDSEEYTDDNYISLLSNQIFLHSDPVEITQLYIRKVIEHIFGGLASSNMIGMSEESTTMMEELGITISDRHLQQQHATCDFTPCTYVVKEAEVYTAIHVPNAVTFLHEIQPYVERLFREHTANRYEQERGDYNSLSIAGNMQESIYYAFYPKTSNSLRVEVRYARRSLRSIIGTGELSTAFPDMQPYLDFAFNRGVTDLLNIINRLPSHIREASTAPDQVSFHAYSRFLTELNLAVMQRFHLERLAGRQDDLEASLYNEAFNRIINACMTRGRIIVRKRTARGHVDSIIRHALDQMHPEFFSKQDVRYGNPRHYQYTLRPSYFQTLRNIAASFPDHRARFIEDEV